MSRRNNPIRRHRATLADLNRSPSREGESVGAPWQSPVTAINEWWAGDPTQRFWMEITDREDVGADLFAPTTNSSGKPYWGYELVTHVKPGDIVFHWHKYLAGEPGIVGYSQATGTYEDTDIRWQARAANSGGNLDPRPAWRMPLLNYTPLQEPLLMDEVRGSEKELRKVLAKLEAMTRGATVYFPFNFSDKRPLRAQQTYFVKMPAEVVDVLNLVVPTGDGTAAAVAEHVEPGKSAKRTDAGYIADSAVRSAIEWCAVNLAIEAYTAEGYAVTYTGASKPYDLEVTQDGEVRRVEVKGSSGAASTVELTHGEVNNSRVADVPTDLFVVDGISW